MRRIILSLLLAMAVSIAGFAQANKMIGKWKTIDDKDGSVKSIVYVFKATNGKYYGRRSYLKIQNNVVPSAMVPTKTSPLLGL